MYHKVEEVVEEVSNLEIHKLINFYNSNLQQDTSHSIFRNILIHHHKGHWTNHNIMLFRTNLSILKELYGVDTQNHNLDNLHSIHL